jgi:hypothetical protein
MSSYPGSSLLVFVVLVAFVVLVLGVLVLALEVGTFSMGLLENREDNLEKNEDLAAYKNN